MVLITGQKDSLLGKINEKAAQMCAVARRNPPITRVEHQPFR